MLNNPRVEAEYYAWAASVERITGARSLPDPRITFEADITDTVMSLMPGLMIDLPGPGKLRAAGDVVAAESRVAYFRFEIEVLGPRWPSSPRTSACTSSRRRSGCSGRHSAPRGP